MLFYLSDLMSPLVLNHLFTLSIGGLNELS